MSRDLRHKSCSSSGHRARASSTRIDRGPFGLGGCSITVVYEGA